MLSVYQDENRKSNKVFHTRPLVRSAGYKVHIKQNYTTVMLSLCFIQTLSFDLKVPKINNCVALNQDSETLLVTGCAVKCQSD